MIELHGLASLINVRNVVDHEIARLIDRPAHAGHIGEFVAAAVFEIDLHHSATHKASDGRFRSGALAGATVNIKYGTRTDGMLNLVASTDIRRHPDWYLVLTGPSVGAISSKGLSAPWVIQQVFLFDPARLLAMLAAKGRRPGGATSLPASVWTDAMIYPLATNPVLVLDERQRTMIGLFSG